MSRLGFDRLELSGAELPAHQRNRTECAPAIAPLGDLQVCPGRTSKAQTRACRDCRVPPCRIEARTGLAVDPAIEGSVRYAGDDLRHARVGGEIDERVDLRE